MRRIGWAVGAAALAFAAACNRAPLPLSDAERAAIADSINQMATQMMASFATPATAASVDKMLSYYVKGDALVHAEYGMIYPSYDSLVKGVRAMIRPGATYKVALDLKRLTVLDRDVVVFSALLNGTFTDSAGKAMPVHEAWMAVYHRTPDGWKIAADHESVPPPAPTPAKPKRRGR